MKSAILITYDKEDAINEAKGLCDAAGFQVVHTIEQKFLKRPKYGISGGILERLEEISEKIRPDVIVFDEVLKPSQNYNLAAALHRENRRPCGIYCKRSLGIQKTSEKGDFAEIARHE